MLFTVDQAQTTFNNSGNIMDTPMKSGKELSSIFGLIVDYSYLNLVY